MFARAGVFGLLIGSVFAVDATARAPSDKHAAAEAVAVNYAYVTTPGRERFSANGTAKGADRVTFSAVARTSRGGEIVGRVRSLRMRRAGGNSYRYEKKQRKLAIAVSHRYVTATLRACNKQGCTRLIVEFENNRIKRSRFVRE